MFNYLINLHNCMELTYFDVAATVVLIDRFQAAVYPTQIHADVVELILAVSLQLHMKMSCDFRLKNLNFVKIIGVELAVFNRCESRFCHLINFKLFISLDNINNCLVLFSVTGQYAYSNDILLVASDHESVED